MGWRLARADWFRSRLPMLTGAAVVATALDEHAALIASPATDHRSSGEAAAAACLALAA